MTWKPVSTAPDTLEPLMLLVEDEYNQMHLVRCVYTKENSLRMVVGNDKMNVTPHLWDYVN